MSENEEFIYIRENGINAKFSTEEDYITFIRALERTNVDIDEDIDIWINWINKRLLDRGLDEIEIKLFFERFKMAI